MLEAWTKVAEPQVTAPTEFEANHSAKLSELTGFGDQLKLAFTALGDVAAQADFRLRSEIGQVTKVIDQAVGTLKRQVDALEAPTQAARAAPLSAAAAEAPSAAPALGVQAEQLAEFERKTSELGQVSTQTQERLAGAEKCLSDHENGLRQLDAVVRDFNARFMGGNAQPCVAPTLERASQLALPQHRSFRDAQHAGCAGDARHPQPSR